MLIYTRLDIYVFITITSSIPPPVEYDWVDSSAGGVLVLDGIILPVVS